MTPPVPAGRSILGGPPSSKRRWPVRRYPLNGFGPVKTPERCDGFCLASLVI